MKRNIIGYTADQPTTQFKNGGAMITELKPFPGNLVIAKAQGGTVKLFEKTFDGEYKVIMEGHKHHLKKVAEKMGKTVFALTNRGHYVVEISKLK